jgi:hypothetical protein
MCEMAILETPRPLETLRRIVGYVICFIADN